MQARAIFEAATEVARRTGKAPIPEIMVPLVASRNELDLVKERDRGRGRTGGKETGVAIELLGGHHDRTAARGAAGRRDRRVGGVLLLRHQRPDADHIRHQPRRRRALHRRIHRPRASSRPTPSSRSTSRVWANSSGSAPSADGSVRPGAQDRNLRRTRRRSGLDRILREAATRLCVVFAIPRAHRQARGSTGKPFKRSRYLECNKGLTTSSPCRYSGGKTAARVAGMVNLYSTATE